jgi:hypothetical protein
LLDYSTWGVVQGKGNVMAHPKIGSRKQTGWQLQSAKVGLYWGKTAVHAGINWRRTSPLAAAIAMISQATVLDYY